VAGGRRRLRPVSGISDHGPRRLEARLGAALLLRLFRTDLITMGVVAVDAVVAGEALRPADEGAGTTAAGGVPRTPNRWQRQARLNVLSPLLERELGAITTRAVGPLLLEIRGAVLEVLIEVFDQVHRVNDGDCRHHGAA